MQAGTSLLIHHKVTKEVWELGHIATDARYETHLWSTPGRFEFTYQNALDPSLYLALSPGDNVTFRAPDMTGTLQDIFSGYVFTKKTNRYGEVTVTAYDQLRYLKANDSMDCSGLRVDQVIEKIAAKYGLYLGALAQPAWALKAQRYDNRSLYTIIEDALEQTNVGLSPKNNTTFAPFYVFYDSFGKLYLTECHELTSPVVIGSQSLLTDYAFSEDIDADTYNVVKVIVPHKESGHADVYEARDGKTTEHLTTQGVLSGAAAKNAGPTLDQWGTLQYYAVVDENATPAQAAQHALDVLGYYDRQLNTLTISTLGVIGVRAGTTMWVNLPDLTAHGNLNQQAMQMDRVMHHWEDSVHEMELEMRVIR